MDTSTNLIAAAKAKLAKLEAELRLTPLFAEIESLRSSIKVFEKILSEDSTSKTVEVAFDFPRTQSIDLLSGDRKMPRASTAAQQEGQKSSKSEAVTQAATALLREKFPRTTKELLSGMTATGVVVGGSDELANLSAYLSKAGTFVHRRKLGGWFLKDQVEKEENPQAEGTGG